MLRLADAILPAFLISVLVPQAGAAQPVSRAAPGSALQGATGSAPQGEALFTGNTRLHNGGPACISCHNIAGVPFPGGGTLGPDLTEAYRKLGPAGTQSAMQTLYFRVMTPIYAAHPLLPAEQADLLTFLQQAESRPSFPETIPIVLLAAVILGAVFVALTGLLWRDRVKSVRRTLVRRATREEARL